MLKKDVAAQFFATNLHLQELHVFRMKDGAGGDGETSGEGSEAGLGGDNEALSLEGVYDTVTVGAFAAHARGFKKGGIRQLQEEIVKVRKRTWRDVERKRGGGACGRTLMLQGMTGGAHNHALTHDFADCVDSGERSCRARSCPSRSCKSWRACGGRRASARKSPFAKA